MNIDVRTGIALALGGALLFGCDAPEHDTPTPAQQEESLTLADGGLAQSPFFEHIAQWSCKVPKVRACSDGQVAAILLTANQGEVELAQSVIDRLESPEAKALAERLIADHAQAKQKLEALVEEAGIEPRESANSKELEDGTKLEIAALATKSGEELETSFVSHAVLDHVKDLGLIDHLLLPSVRHPKLARHVREERATIAVHALLASDVQADTVGSCGGEQEPAPMSDAGSEDDGGSSVGEVDAGEPAAQ